MSLISSTSFSWHVAVVTFGVSTVPQSVGFWVLFCGWGERLAYGTNVLHSITPLGFNAGSAH